MKILGNILWLMLGGFICWLGWICIGILWCITIIGIPVGLQCFKLASITIWPFGKEIVTHIGVGSIVMNMLWLLFGGLLLAIGYIASGLLLCVTVVGIPFGLQSFKLSRMALFPFGSQAYPKDV